MEPQLSNNLATFKTLRRLQEMQLYIGEVRNSSFNLKRTKFPNNYCITGKLNKTGVIQIKADLVPPMNIALNGILLLMGVLAIWVYKIPIASLMLIAVGISIFISHNIKCRKELGLFQECFSKHKVTTKD